MDLPDLSESTELTKLLALLDDAQQFATPFYQQPARAYHNLKHLQHMLEQLQQRQLLTPTLALATWGHDLIYDPKASDNEEQSAQKFGDYLRQRGASNQLVNDVQRLILATKQHQSQQPDEAALIDADLSILGSPAEQFATYQAGIRAEYGHVANWLYRLGRRRVLQGFLSRPRIFTTAEFADLEQPARKNLQLALASRRS